MQIYKTTNLINGKIYVGQEKGNNEQYLGSGKIIRYAIEKYGIENFKKDIIKKCWSIEEMNESEKYWIKALNSFSPKGYNISTGGDWGDMFTYNPNKELIRGNMKKASQKRSKEISKFMSKFRHGRHLSIETKRKISLANTGKKHSNETKIKLCISQKRRFLDHNERLKISLGSIGKINSAESNLKRSITAQKNPNYGMKGKKHSEDSKNKIGLANTERLIKKYGNINEIIINCKKCNKEIKYFKREKNIYFKQFCSKGCATSFRQLGKKFSQEQCLKIGISKLGKKYPNRKMSDEGKLKIKHSNEIKKLDPKIKEKRSESAKLAYQTRLKRQKGEI